MIDFDFSTKCYSCGACKAVCPKNAITMSENCIPTVGESCVNCGLCEKVCPNLNEQKYSRQVDGDGYVAKNKNLGIRKNSSSGGVFQLLANEAIRRGWYVCGCIYDEELMPRHIVSNNEVVIRDMMGSKYVKSDLADALVQIKKLRMDGVCVLFSGTPCQVAAVKNMFPEDEKIVCIGVVCHGSIERDIWKAYLEQERKRGSIQAVTMRDKTKGWLNYGLKFSFEDGTEHITYRKANGYFLKAFTDGLLERDRCLDCAYKGDQIKADILLGDAWGMETECADLADEWGLSSVICLSDIGRGFFDAVQEELEVREVSVKKLIEKNQRIVSPAKVDTRYKAFRKKFDASPEKIQKLCEQYEKPTIMNRISAKLRSMR